jgi:peptidyl-tRNA hydrolase, PTH1 family
MAWLVAGLGNPGESYARTRHNVGRMVVDELARSHDARLKKVRFLPTEAAEIWIGAERVWLVGSTRFMNESGSSYAGFARKHDVDPERVVAVHDELEIPAGELMLKLGGGSGGHNGLKSLSQALGTQAFHRVRVGIGRPPGRQDPADYVLQPIGKSQLEDLAVTIARAADAVGSLITEGLEAAQQRFNRGAAPS